MKNDKEEFKKKFKGKIYRFTLKLVGFMDKLPQSSSAQIMGKQLLRCGTSIGANYVEAQAASSRKDFANFFHHSLKSANESKFWLSLLKDSGKADKNEATILIEDLNEISNIPGSSLLTLKNRK